LIGIISLPNTESTILENWPGPKTIDALRKPVYHFALRQEGMNLDFHLEQFFKSEQISLHRFTDFYSLIQICQRFAIDAIMFGGSGDFLSEIDMIHNIKKNMFLSIIPVILYHPDPDNAMVVAAYESGVEDFIRGNWHERLSEVRIRKAIDRNRRDLSVNPSTYLPGPSLIEKEVARQIQLGEEFAICYADLDNFKAFNDFYGYGRGDKVIKLTARIIKDIVFDVCPGGFVGHIAGDDFIYVIPSGLIDTICGHVIKTFDTIIQYKYDAIDRDRGFIETTNRRGELDKFPLLSISIAVLVNKNRMFEHLGELSRMLADLKKATKQKDGSNYMVERRSKY